MSESSTTRAQQIYYKAVDRLAENQPEEAAVLFREALAEDADLLDAMHGLVRACMDAGDLDGGLAAAHTLAERAPDDVLAQTSLSILYQRKGMIAEAEAAATRAKLLGWKHELRAGRREPSL